MGETILVERGLCYCVHPRVYKSRGVSCLWVLAEDFKRQDHPAFRVERENATAD